MVNSVGLKDNNLGQRSLWVSPFAGSNPALRTILL